MDIKELNDVKELVTAGLKKLGDESKDQFEKAIAEAKKTGDMLAKDKEKVDEILVKQGEFQAQLLDVQQKIDRKLTEERDSEPLTAGQAFVESEEFKAYVGERNLKKQVSVNVKAITSLSTSAGTLVLANQIPGILAQPTRRLRVRDLISQANTSQPSIQYRRELVYTNSAAPVSEGDKKPESNITFDDQTARVIKLAHFIKASDEILDDAPALQGFVDTRLRYGLESVEETQLLKGSGVGNNLNGIYTQATTYAAPLTPPQVTLIDQFRLMLLQAELAEFPPDGIVMHPVQWASIELTKDTNRNYIIGNPQGTLSPTLWGRPVVATQAMTIDTGLVGSFRMGATVFDRKQATITVATENEDDFVKNLVTILAEERLALIVWRPAAFIKSTNLVGS